MNAKGYLGTSASRNGRPNRVRGHPEKSASMDESEAADIEVEEGTATPIFGVYRRGYDPEQVDRYVADQQRRLDESVHRASESERKLAAAVGQLRELHRRVAVYESEARNAQPPALDTLGERVQRILQEAWEGAYNLRQEAEREVTDLREQTNQDVTELREQTQVEVAELRQQTQHEVEAMRVQARSDVEELREAASREAASLVDEATRRALHIRDETERRRQAYLERVERDREQAIGQITYLYDQRQGAIAELARLQATVQATIEEMVHSPLGRPAPGVAEVAAENARAARAATAREHPAPADEGFSGIGSGSLSRAARLPDTGLMGDPPSWRPMRRGIPRRRAAPFSTPRRPTSRMSRCSMTPHSSRRRPSCPASSARASRRCRGRASTCPPVRWSGRLGPPSDRAARDLATPARKPTPWSG